MSVPLTQEQYYIAYAALDFMWYSIIAMILLIVLIEIRYRLSDKVVKIVSQTAILTAPTNNQCQKLVLLI